MKFRVMTTVAAAAALALSLSACAATSLFTPPPGASQAVQDELAKAKAEADTAVLKALTDKMAHCGLTGTVALGAGGLAGTGTGFANTLQLTCPGQAYGPNDFSPNPASLQQLAAMLQALQAAAPAK